MEESFENLLNQLRREKTGLREAEAKAQAREQEQAEIQQRIVDAQRVDLKTAQGKLLTLYQLCGIEAALVLLNEEIASHPKYSDASLVRKLHCVRPQGWLRPPDPCSQWYYDSAKRELLQPLPREIVLADDNFIDAISWTLTLNMTSQKFVSELITTRTWVDASITAEKVMVNGKEVTTATQQTVQIAVVDAFRNPRTVEEHMALYGGDDDGTGRY